MIKRFNPDFSLSISHELAYMRETPEGGYVAHGDYATLFSELEVVKAERDALAVENAALKDTLGYICNRGNEPEYHDCGMGCGLEDRGITDRYEAMYHGWESAMSRMYSDVIPDAMPETPATDAALAAIEARGVEKFSDMCCEKSKMATTADSCAGWSNCGVHASSFAIRLREAK
ncbi:hypothetical protein [Serratia liquefaciens]|uniref:hypothetical protein n=1 Tax=Serratia liquefaciens TaxID=614 RepID=UPI00217C0D76|nr:hypothetical protein [Serratia liquefaciens]CAI1635369.1 Uncharacterised protein [Serratia liquefaciens]